jgi:hypothetical protein
MSRNSVRQILGDDYTEFRKTKFSKSLTDDYNFAHLYYNENDLLEAIEFLGDGSISLELDGKELMGISYNSLKNIIAKLDDNLVTEQDSFTSNKLGIGAYAPKIAEDKAAIPESIIVFAEGYYN